MATHAGALPAGGLPFVAFLLGLIISSFVDKLYGVSQNQVAVLLLRGPFRRVIPHYEDPRRAKGKGG